MLSLNTASEIKDGQIFVEIDSSKIDLILAKAKPF
jgi:hypothetical protein